MQARFTLLSLFLFFGCTASLQEGGENFYKNSEIPKGQLPDVVTPLNYNLYFELDPRKDSFAGKAEIELSLDASMDHFWMHGRDLDIKKAELRLENGTAIPVDYRQVTPEGLVHIGFRKQVESMVATLVIHYRAKLQNNLQGCYKVSEKGEDYLFTQFESTYARTCFPSFDEPRFKTSFQLNITLPSTMKVVANTPIMSSEPSGKLLTTHHFAPTKDLPTYLVAMAAGHLEIVEAGNIESNKVRKRPIPFRGVAVKGKGKDLKYALEKTPQMIHELEAYFGTPYPYEKLDIIAVPDFAAGAMENAGAITFREWLILLDEDASVSQVRSFYNVMAHELAHQWFGNLVTMAWWDDLWLNEAFATWMAYKIVHKIDETQRSEMRLLERGLNAMKADSFTSTRKIAEPIRTHHDIHSAFDAITYAKGAAVLAMFEKDMGEKAFQKGVQYYLRQFAYGTGTTSDFLESLSEGSGKNVKAEFESFLYQEGVPLVDVTVQCGLGFTRLKMRQKRYFPLGITGDTNRTWQIPMCVKVGYEGKSEKTCFTMKSGVDSLDLPNPTCPQYVLPNADGASYLLYTLSEEWSEKLLTHGYPLLSAPEKRTVFHNLQAQFRAGENNAAQLFKAMALLGEEKDAYLAKSPLRAIQSLSKNMAFNGTKKAFNKFVKNKFGNVLSSLKNRTVSSDEKLLRRDLYNLLALVLKDEESKKELLGLGEAYYQALKSGKRIAGESDSNLNKIALAAYVRKMGMPVIVDLRNLVAKLSDTVRRKDLLFALAKVDDLNLTSQISQLILSKSLRSNEVLSMIWNLSAHNTTRDAMWSWYRAHESELVKVLSEKRLGSIPFVASAFCAKDKAAEVKRHFLPNIDRYPGGPRNLVEVEEEIAHCAEWVKVQQGAIQNHFGKQS